MMSSLAPSMLHTRKEGNIDDELVARISQELRFEKENNPSSGDLPAHLRKFLDASSFQLKDVQGQQEVKLTRSFGNEIINITFSISALSNLVAPDDAVQDFSMYGLDDLLPDTQPVGKLFKNANNQNGTKVPEDNIAPVDGAELIDNGVAKSYPVPMNIIIEKESMEGALAFGVAADDGDIRISRISHYSKKEWTSAKMTEQRYAHEASYTGPAYGNLDEDIQRLVEDYLRERGINTALAQWVPEYIDFKEQREYMKWLDDLKLFVKR